MAADHALLATFNKLGLNQSRLAKRRGRFPLICYLRTVVVACTRADDVSIVNAYLVKAAPGLAAEDRGERGAAGWTGMTPSPTVYL
jgi:hypothetical protein